MSGLGGEVRAKESAKEPQILEPQADVSADAKALDDGLTIPAFAHRHLLTETEVWRRLRRGELVGRTQDGQLLIYQSLEQASDLGELPPLPPSEERLARDLTGRAGATNEGASFLSLTGDRGHSPELALLLDHLSLAKEENREILRMTQDSIRQISRMSDSIAQMKDSVIAAKDSELTALKEQLAQRDLEIAKLRQHSEDLEMLAHAVVTAKHE